VASLAEHDSWQVRAEVAESLGQSISSNYSSRLKIAAAAADAIRRLLADGDSFVVARAVAACSTGEIEAQAELADVAERLPEIAPLALTAMASSSEGRVKAVPYLRKFTNHADATVRAAALTALVECTNTNIADELGAGFRDGDTRVRRAAADGISTLVKREEEVPAAVVKAWKDPLEGLLSAEDAEERCAGAAALVVMRLTDKALPALEALAKDNPDLAPRIAACLESLPWQEKKDLFEYLMSLDLTDEAYQATIEGLVEEPTKEAAVYLWAQVDGNPGALELLYTLQNAIQRVYFGKEGLWREESRSPGLLKLMAEESLKRLDSEDERVRMLALALLCVADPGQTIEKAESYFAADGTAASMRRNALAVLMLLKPQAQLERAVDACRSGDEKMQILGAGFLAEGTECSECQSLEVDDNTLYVYRSGSASYKPAKPPKSLTADVLLPLLSKPQPYLRSCAAYLLAELGDTTGMATLAAVWRQSEDSTTRGFLVDAVSSLDDDSYTPILEELYNSMNREEDAWEIRDFYWKIRVIKGPKVLALRKRIRDEVGMENLRQ